MLRNMVLLCTKFILPPSSVFSVVVKKHSASSFDFSAAKNGPLLNGKNSRQFERKHIPSTAHKMGAQTSFQCTLFPDIICFQSFFFRLSWRRLLVIFLLVQIDYRAEIRTFVGHVFLVKAHFFRRRSSYWETFPQLKWRRANCFTCLDNPTNTTRGNGTYGSNLKAISWATWKLIKVLFVDSLQSLLPRKKNSNPTPFHWPNLDEHF